MYWLLLVLVLCDYTYTNLHCLTILTYYLSSSFILIDIPNLSIIQPFPPSDSAKKFEPRSKTCSEEE